MMRLTNSRVDQLAPSDSATPESALNDSTATTEPGVLKVRFWLWLAGIAAASLQAWAFRRYVSADALSYFDIARGCAHGHWHALINAYWSPLFPLLLSLVFRAFPSLYWESTLAHLTNIAIFGFAFASFEFLVASLVRELRRRSEAAAHLRPLQEWMLWALCDGIFVCYTLLFRMVSELTPELCMAGLVFLAVALLVRIRAEVPSYWTYAGFGAVLGLSYLAKSVMFPLSFVLLACCFCLYKPHKRSLLGSTLALMCFAAVASPFIYELSLSKGRPTFGDTGKIAYAEYVNGATRLTDWQGGPDGNGRAVHPTRQILVNPPLFEFSTPVGGTYPPWYDPSYWYEGITATFRLRDQLRAIRYTTQEYVGILPYWAGVLVGFLALLPLSSGDIWRNILRQWPLLLPAAAGLGTYALVHVEPRLVLPFLLLGCAGLFASLPFQDASDQRGFSRMVTIAIVAVLWLGVGWTGVRSVFHALAPQRFVDWEVAEGLHHIGVEPGDEIASLSNSFTAYWAHLAGVRIVADILPGDDEAYWSALPRTQSEILRDFARAGAKVVVADQTPPSGLQTGWKRIGRTNFFAYQLRPYTNPTSPDDLNRH